MSRTKSWSVAGVLAAVDSRSRLSGRAERLLLSTQPMMYAAHLLYEKHGFVRHPSRDRVRPGRTYLAYELDLRTASALR